MGKYATALLAVAMLGCAGQPKPTATSSVVVFILPGMTSASGAYQPTYGATPSVSLHDVSSPERKIVGVLTVGQKLAYQVPPGKHEFMLLNRGSTDFMEANIGGGKTYYVVVQLLAASGYDQRYGFRPVRPGDFDSDLFARWETNVSFVDRPEAWRQWSSANQGSIETRLRGQRPLWDKQGPAERRLKTLEVSDGR
jgi:hypothetical protein